MKELKPGSPDAARRDRLLAIMRDEMRPQDERIQAAIEALPLCHEELPPIVTYTGSRDITVQGKRRRGNVDADWPKTLA